ncbi:sensor histidine kinase [Chryseobacterium sp. sg2396]|uniref:sensor histidine kinase n=1 Tax=Chryseobacterium sp. sg2396 TaxID=3276280 RepID=UPI0036719316
MKFYFLTALVISLFLKSQHYTSQWYNVDNGLPQNTVKDITKDEYGFVWILTNNGVVRYDGNQFLIPKRNINTVNFYEFKSFGKDIYSLNFFIREYIKISERQVNILTYKSYLLGPYAPEDGRTYFFLNQNSANNKFYPIADFFIIPLGKERYFFGKNTIEYQKDPSSERIVIGKNFHYTMLKNAFVLENVVHIADPVRRKTIILRDGKISYDNQPSFCNDPKTKIYWFQSKNQVFMINHGKIYLSSRLNNGRPVFRFIADYKDIEKDYIGSMFYDEENQKLYIGSLLKGLNILSLSNFYISQKKVPFTDEICYAALPLSRHSIIAQDGTEYFRDSVKKRYQVELFSDDRRLAYDRSKNVLYVDYGMIYRKSRSTGYKKGDSISLDEAIISVNKINDLFMVGKMGHDNTSILEIFKDDRFKKAEASVKIPEKMTTVVPYSRDLIFVGTYGGLYLLSLSQKKIIKKLAGNINIKNVIRSASGHYWLTTYSDQGFYLLKNLVPVRLPADREQAISGAHTFLEDKNGFFWISTNNGLFRVREKTLLNYADNKINPVYYYRYTKLNGLLNNEFNTAYPGGNILEDGDFVFPSMEGFVFFRPQEVKRIYPKKNTLFVERAYSSKENFAFKNKLKIKSNFKLLNIFLDIPYFSDIENIHLQARLKGGNHDQWKDIGNNRMYVMDEDSPGDYSLEIRYLTSENTFAYKILPIEIVPFFYQTFWFRLLVGFILLCIIMVIIRVRTSFLQGKNRNLKENLDIKDKVLEATRDMLKNESEQKAKIIQSISHDITTPLSYMSYLTQQLNDTENPDKQKELFEMLHKTSEQLFTFTSGLKEYTKLFHSEAVFEKEEYELCSLIDTKAKLFEEIALKRDTVIVNLCDADFKTRVNKTVFAVILHNLIDNAVKHTIGGKITISAEKFTDMTIFEVTDTGHGMSDEQILYYNRMFENGEEELLPFKNEKLGLPMVIRLLRKIGAEIRFQKNNPTGTRVTIIRETLSL